MKKSRNNLKSQNQQDNFKNNKALLSTSNNSYLNSDSQSNFNSRSKKKGDEKAVILGINASSNKNSSKDGTFKVHHYRNDYDPELFIETSQIIIKKKDQLIALDKYVFGNNSNNKQNKVHEKKVSIIGINPENQQPGKISSSHRHRVKNPNPKPGQITSTAVLTPDGLYQQISSNDGEYITVDSSTPFDPNDSNNNIAQRKSKAKLDSSFESSDIFKKNINHTKSIQAEIESSFVDSNIGISPRNPHGLWKNNEQNETIEVEYEYVTVDEEEDNEEKSVEKKEVSINNTNTNSINQYEEEIIEYEIIEEEEEEEAELEPLINIQNPSQPTEEEDEYEYVVEEEENEENNQIIPSNSLADVQPLNALQKKQVSIDSNNLQISKNHSDYDEENDYATTEENINTQSFMNSEQNKAKNEEIIFEEEEEEAMDIETNTSKETQNEDNIKPNSENEEVSNKTNNDEIIEPQFQQENQDHISNNGQDNSNKQLNISSNITNENMSKSDQNTEAVSDQINNNDLNITNKSEKETEFPNNEANVSESINVNDIQSSTSNQTDLKDNEPTISIFEEYVFADEKEKEIEKEEEKEEKQKPKLTIVDENHNNISKINDSSFGFNNSQIQERNEKQVSNTLNNLVKNRNHIMKSEIESTEININIVDDFNQNNQNSNTSNSNSPSKALRKLFLSPSNAVESRSGTTENNTNQIKNKNKNKNKSESSINENDQNQTKSNSQFNFEKDSSSKINDSKQQSYPQPNDESDKTNEAENEQTMATCDLDMSNIQKSPPARENSNQNNKNNHNSDDYYSHEYYTTMETNEISNQRGRNKNPNSNNNKNNSRSSRRSRDNDSYYSYSYYSDTYTYSKDPSTIEANSRRNKHHHRGHNNEYTYECITNGPNETIDRSVRPTNDKSNQLPIELQNQIQQQLQNQIQLNSTPQSNQSIPYSIRLRVKDSQRKLFDFDNGKSPKFILRTVSEDGKSTPHNIELVLETKPSSSQTPIQSTNNSTSQSPAASVPVSPTQQRQKNQSVQFDIPQIIQSGPHKGLIKRRIKKSEKAKRESERKMMQVEEEIRKMEQLIVEQDEKKKLQQQQQQRAITESSVEITTSTINEGQSSPFSKSPSKRIAKGRGKKIQKSSINDKQQMQAKNPSSKSSRILSTSSTNSPNRRHYYDENGNPVLVEISDATGRPVFRRIAGKSSASSSIKHGNSNPNFNKNVTQSLPRPVKGRNASLIDQQQQKQQKFGTPKRENKHLILNNDSDEDDKNPLKKSPVRNVRINHQIHLNNDIIEDSDSDIDSDDENFKEFNEKNAENQMEFGKPYRSRKAPHIKRTKFQNPQIHLKPRNGNSNNGSSSGSTPLKKAVFDSDSDSDLDGEEPFRPRNLSPDSKRRKREEITKEIEELRQLLPDQAENDNNNNKEDIGRYSSNKKSSGKPPSIPSNQQKQPKRFVNEEEYDPFEDFDSNLDNLQKSPYEPKQNLNNKENVNHNRRFILDRPPPIQLNNPANRPPSDGSASSLTERRKMPKITVEIPARGNEGQADVFRRHYENASPEKSPQKNPEINNREVNEYDDYSVPLNASTKNTIKNLEEDNQNEKVDENHSSSNLSSKRRVRKRMRVSVQDGSRSPAPHLSSNPLKDSKLSSNSKPNTNSNSNSPSKKQRGNLIDALKANLRQDLNSLDDSDSDDGNEPAENQKNVDQDSLAIGAMNPVQAKRLEESKKQNEIAPFTPPADADLNQSSSMLSNAPPPSPKNQDVEIVIRDGKRKRKKKVSLSPRSGTHSHSSKNSGTRGNVIRSHHLKDSEKYQQDSPPPSVLSSIANENDLND